MQSAPAGFRSLSSFALGPGEPAVTANLWYPAQAGSKERAVRYAGVFLGRAASAAPAQAAPSRGLCLLVHGLRGTAHDLAWLGEPLARAGYVALAFAQPGVCFQTFDPARAPQIWRRASQLGRALDVALADPAIGPLVAGRPVHLVGHSAGASAAFVLAGAHADTSLFARRYTLSGPLQASPPADQRLGTVVALAPGTGEVFTNAGMAKMQLPCLVVSGEADASCPDLYNAARYAKHMPRAAWYRVAHAGHYVFKPCCNWYGKLRAKGICRDDRRVARARVHAAIGALVLRLFAGEALPTGPSRSFLPLP